MDLRKTREQLGRIRVYYLKGDTLRALASAVMALRDLAQMSNLPTDMRSMLRDGIGFLARDEELKRYLKRPLAYQPGQEKALFIQLGAAYKEMGAQAGQESRDEAFARKQKLDRALNMGQKLVAQGKFSEAEEAFREAVSYYRDEHRLFQMIAKCFIDADQPRRAIDYLRKALEIERDNEPARLMLEEASSSGN